MHELPHGAGSPGLEAQQIDTAVRRGRDPGPLAGVPVAIKDVIPTAGIRTTYGSSRYADHVPDVDHVIVQRIREAGGIVVGKTNTPEFAAYVNTTSTLAGTTVNPYDTLRTSGGSSGGSAVAVATGMCAVAHGSDLGGSLRIPAAFTGVVGLRPSVGRVPDDPSPWPFDPHAVHGPLARDALDADLLLSVLDGTLPRSEATPSSDVGSSLDTRLASSDLRLAWTPDLGGLCNVEAEIAARVTDAIRQLADADAAIVSEAGPPLTGLTDAIVPLRAYRARIVLDEELRAPLENQLLEELLASSAALSLADVAAAERRRSDVWHACRPFFDRYDVLATVTTQVEPFAADEPFPTAINGTAVTDPLAAFHSTYAVSLLGWAAVTLPCGMTAAGLPIGLQLIAPSGQDHELLKIASHLEAHLPPVPAPPLRGW